MNGALEILRRERDDAAEQIRVLRTRIRDLEAAINVLDGQPLAEKTGRTSGDLKSSVLSKLKELPEGATPKELANTFTSDGRVTSDASVSSTLSRLKNDSKVFNRGGRWFASNTNDNIDLRQNSSHLAGWDDQDDETPF